MEKSIEGLGDPNYDFFNQNPLFKLLPNCKALIHTEGQAQASKYAWAVVLLYHIKSPFHRDDNKVKMIAEGYLDTEEGMFEAFLSNPEIDEFVEEIKCHTMTPLEYELSINIDAIKKARKLVFDSTKASDITAYLEKTPKIMRELLALQTEILKMDYSEKGQRTRKTSVSYTLPTYEKVITPENQEMSHDDYD